MIPLEGKRRWCRGTPERQRRRTSGEQCRSIFTFNALANTHRDQSDIEKVRRTATHRQRSKQAPLRIVD
ncbi:hypothetical protein MRB53_022718 [Persea americana]|uniref:Uncharacterized protein n=1 Tax=Persea americana TaxID=3435 RepID=A0ACC2L7T4_PERAE|nr:hypothetical protein MRB53_022718 [Persea americana]